MDVRASDLAAALAERVNPVLPEGFQVFPERSVLRVRAATRWISSVDVDLRGFFVGMETDSEVSDVPRDYVFDRAATAVYAFLNTMQDYVSEELTMPWPQDATSNRRAMAMPFVTIDGNVLRSGFGQPDRLTIAFAPIELTALLR